MANLNVNISHLEEEETKRMPLSDSDRKWYIKQIKKYSLSNDIAIIDEDDSSIIYNHDLATDESRIKPIEPEEVVHALILQILSSPDYKYSKECLYHEKHYAHGSKGSLADEVDIMIFDPDGIPYALWEVKSAEEAEIEKEAAIKNQLFGTAPLTGGPSLLVFGTIQPQGSQAKIDIICIDYKKYKSYDSWVEAGRPHSTEFPAEYLDINYTPYIKDSFKDLNMNCTQSDFRALATTFHNEFFGEHPDNTLFLNLVKCFLAKIYDEKTTKNGDAYKFQIFIRNGKPDSAKTVFKEINSLYEIAYGRYIDPNSKKNDYISDREFTPEQVKLVVSALEGMSITKGAALHGDIIGAFFEEILRAGFRQDRGMYFTHDNIVKFMVECIDLEGLTKRIWNDSDHPDNRLPHIIDPACGSGTFLLHAMNTVTKCIKSNESEFIIDDESRDFYEARLSDKKPNYWAERFIYGFDPKFIMAITAKVNMVLHGDGSTHIFKDDAFRSFSKYSDPQLRAAGEGSRSLSYSAYPYDMCETFDVLISNPPFGITLSQETRRNRNKIFSIKDSQPSEALFIERAFQLLKPGGRLGLVLPESIFNASELHDTRKFLYRVFKIKSIVSLPRNLFIDTPTLTSLLFAEKKSCEEINEWDGEWNKHESIAFKNVKKAKNELSVKGSKKYDNVHQLFDNVFQLINPYLGGQKYILKRGKNSELVKFCLPEGVEDIEAIRLHLLKFIKTAGFNSLVNRYIFEKVTESISYEFPVFRVSDVGYKLSKRKEKAKPNQLIRFISEENGGLIRNLHLCDQNYKVDIDLENPSTILDFIKIEKIWE